MRRLFLADESRADDDIVVFDLSHQAIEVLRQMLSVRVKLDCAIVILLQGVFDSCLESSCKSEVDWKVEKPVSTFSANIGRRVS